MDVKRAFVHAPVLREIYVEILDEMREPGEEDHVGRLQKALYGTRDAPMSWQNHISEVLAEMGFQKGAAQPCLLKHRTRDIQLAHHVDDFFLVIGLESDLVWFKKMMNQEFETTSEVLGPEAHNSRKVTFVNRIIRWLPMALPWRATPNMQRLFFASWALWMLRMQRHRECGRTTTPTRTTTRTSSARRNRRRLGASLPS